MAKTEDRKAQLIANLAQARGELSQSVSHVRQSMSVREQFKRNGLFWILGAVVAGVGLSQLGRGKKELAKTAATATAAATVPGVLPSRTTAIVLSCLSMVCTLLKPAVTAFVSDFLKRHGDSRRF